MRWLGNYILEWLKGPWPEIMFIRHGHGMHQVGYEMKDAGLADSPGAALGVDVSNHLVPLSPLGRWQSTTTKTFIGWKPDVVYTSLMERAYETATLIFPGYYIRQDPRLNEKDFGPAHMVSDEHLMKHYPDFVIRYKKDGKYYAAKAPGGENYVDLFIRLHSVLDTLRRDWAGKKVAVVCHSAVMLSFRQLLERFSPEDLIKVSKEEDLANCSILHYGPINKLWGWRKGKFRIHLLKSPHTLWRREDVPEDIIAKKTAIELEQLREKYKETSS